MEYKDIEKVNLEIKKTDIKGKKYAEVSERILAFRKLNPNGRIITEIIDKTENDVTVKATAKKVSVILGKSFAEGL